MPPTPVIAILDIGKTNKKLFLFDAYYNIVWEENAVLPLTTDEDGDACEDLPGLNTWMMKALSKAGTAGDFDIRAINFSAYGASLVYTGSDGNPIPPLYNYLKPYPEKLKKEFYQLYGGELSFSMITASPVLGSLNSGMQIYRIKKEKPKQFHRFHYALHLPQYLSWMLTGRAVSDITSLGCHTNLWNFSQQGYHEWVYREGVIDKMAPMESPDAVYPLDPHPDFRILPPAYSNSVAGVGLHDSSAAMIPYLESFREPFILISTGTWCISMNPFNASPLTIAELKQDCLSYMTFRGQPMKSSRLFAGYEHELQVERLSVYFQQNKNYYKSISYEPATVKELERKNDAGLHPGSALVSASVFAQRELSSFKNFEEAYHRLMMDIMEQQEISTRLIMADRSVKRIFVDGGFGKNELYMHLLAAAFPELEVFAATIAQASAIGAAMAIHPHWNPFPLPTNIIILKYYKR